MLLPWNLEASRNISVLFQVRDACFVNVVWNMLVLQCSRHAFGIFLIDVNLLATMLFYAYGFKCVRWGVKLDSLTLMVSSGSSLICGVLSLVIEQYLMITGCCCSDTFYCTSVSSAALPCPVPFSRICLAVSNFHINGKKLSGDQHHCNGNKIFGIFKQ